MCKPVYKHCNKLLPKDHVRQRLDMIWIVTFREIYQREIDCLEMKAKTVPKVARAIY